MNEVKAPRVTFGMIVLNGVPFIRHNLRALYGLAHQIIVVEGACPAAAVVATADGHSMDGTVEAVRRFCREEDPEGKVILVTAEEEGHRDGFWSEKDEMSQAYAKRATGDYLWQVDVDEFYLPEQMAEVLRRFDADPSLGWASFRVLTFWGDPSVRTDSEYLRAGAHDFFRLFRWGTGFSYSTHRPPTVLDALGRSLREGTGLRAADLASEGIFLFHYELLFPKQVKEKCAYYSRVSWTDAVARSDEWARECYFELARPFRVHMMYDYRSWLEPYRGSYPAAIREMIFLVRKGAYPSVTCRDMADVTRLLASPWYMICRSLIKAWLPFPDILMRARSAAAKRVRGTFVGGCVRYARRVIRGARASKEPQGVSTDYERLERDAITEALTSAWKTSAIATAQRRLVEGQLQAMREGRPPSVYSVFRDAVRATGCMPGRILEIGSASGYYKEVLQTLVGDGWWYVGVDYSAALVALARKLDPSGLFGMADALRLPFAADTFPIVVSGCVILHLPGYRAAIAECARVAQEWVIFHRTPITEAETAYFSKLAYGVRCVEICFGVRELKELFSESGLLVERELTVSPNNITYVCRKTSRQR
jgi:SAM-dependent methyltransferase